MATLDYALLAEYARIDATGLVTIVGGSFNRVRVTGASGLQNTYVVLRVLLDEAEDDASFEVSIEPPSKTYSLQFAGTTSLNPDAVPVDGRFGSGRGQDAQSRGWPTTGTPATPSMS